MDISANFKKRRYINGGIGIIIIIALFTLPIWGTEYYVSLFTSICLYATVGQMWNLMAGYAGQISLGQQIFIGLGGYAIAATTNFYGVPILVGLIIGAVVSGLVSMALSLILFRMKGMYFAIATWITAEALIVIFGNWTYVKGGIGMFVKAAYKLSTVDIFYMAVALVVGTLILVNYLLKSKLGLGLMAMRDNDDAAETLGVDIFKAKLVSFLMSGMITGLAGGIFYIQQISINPTSAFANAWTVAAVFIVVIGGIGTVAGPIVGAVVYVFLRQLLTNFGAGSNAFTYLSMVILGIIAIAVILLAPKGIVGTLQSKFNYEILSPRRWAK